MVGVRLVWVLLVLRLLFFTLLSFCFTVGCVNACGLVIVWW